MIVKLKGKISMCVDGFLTSKNLKHTQLAALVTWGKLNETFTNVVSVLESIKTKTILVNYTSKSIIKLIPDTLRKQPAFRDAITGFPAKWCLRNQRRNSILMTYQYPDLGSASDWLKEISHAARPIRSTHQIWVMTHHRYKISAVIPQTQGNLSPMVVASRNVGCFSG